MDKTSLLIYIPVISPTWSRTQAIASGKCPGSLFQISRRAIALIVSIWPLKQTWGFGSPSTEKALAAIRRSRTLSSHQCACGTNSKAKVQRLPCFFLWVFSHNPPPRIMQCKDAAIAQRRGEPNDKSKQGNHLTLLKQEYDTSRPST